MNQRLVFLCIILLLIFSVQAQSLKLVFRYDDLKLKSDTISEHMIAVFQKHKIPIVLAVIPCDASENLILEKNYSFIPALKKGIENKSIEIALHGLNHQRIAIGEFENLNKKEQYRRILKGKLLLDSIFNTKVRTFVPPWNKYDDNTLDVIYKVGMRGISSALCIGQTFSNPHIQYYPETIEDFGTLISVIKQNKKREGVIVVMFHPYSFNRKFTLEQLDNILSEVDKLSYVQCVNFKHLYELKILSDTNRMKSNMEINLMTKFLHLNGVIQTTTYATFVRILNVLLYLVLSGFFFFAPLMLYWKKQITNQKKYGIGFLLMLFVGLSVWFHFLAPLKLLLLVVVISVGTSLGLKIQFKK